MSKDDSWSPSTVLGVSASVMTLLMGADWLWNRSAALTWTFNKIWAILSTDVKLWHLVFTGILIAGGRYFLSEDMEPKNPQKQYQPPNWDGKDNLKGVVWRWFWNGSHATGVTPFCPECDAEMEIQTPSMQLDGTEYESVTDCPNCEFGKYWEEGNPKRPVARIIERNARCGEYGD
jgi:hypothetical protein